MFQMNLSSDEAQVLHEALQCYLSDLRVEVCHTDNREYKSALKRNEACLKRVLDHLAGDRLQAAAD